MLIRLKKARDGVVLTCIRDQGPVTVQQTGYGGFFALHDLMHLAVETTLGLRQAFFGLVSEGWNFETFGDKDDPRYRTMPVEAELAERLVGCLSRRYSERAWQDPELLLLFTEEINQEITPAMTTGFVRLEPEQITQIYSRFDELAARWAAVPIGEHLELEFP
jgi:hypothetical protein